MIRLWFHFVISCGDIFQPVCVVGGEFNYCNYQGNLH